MESASDTMRCCLIIATIARTDAVDRLLESIAAQRHRELRVVLVDQNEDLRLEAIVQRHARDIHIEHLRIPSRGVSAARNAGLDRVGDAELIAFPDDDCFYDPATLSTAIAIFAQHQHAVAIMGSLHLPEVATAWAKLPSDRRTNRRSRIGILRQGGTVVQFFRRAAIDAVGAFDTSFGPGAGTPWLSGEDSDYLIRAWDTGGSVLSCSAVRVYHPAVDATFPGYQVKAFGYGRGRIRLLRKHGYPLWFILANLAHPLVAWLWSGQATRRFRWHMFRGRLHEFLHPL